VSIIQARYGEFDIIEQDSVVSASLKKYGEWAQTEIDLLLEFIDKNAVVVDIGAFIGTHTRAFSALVGDFGEVFSFEPRRETHSVLLKNANLAPMSNIRVLNFALGAIDETITVPPLSLDNQGNFGAAQLDLAGESLEKGEVIIIKTLDSFALKNVKFIKIDVEGMEIAVLNGAKETIEQFNPIVFAECNSLEASYTILQWCRERRYSIHGVISAAFNPNNFACNTENVFGTAKETGLLLIPQKYYEQYTEILEKYKLPKIDNVDDLALLLLHKPQYPYEVLAQGLAVSQLSLLYPSPQADIYSQIIKERDAQITSLNEDINEYTSQLLDKNIQLDQLGGQLRDMELSKAWRITKPLRMAGKLYREKLPHILALVKKAVNNHRKTESMIQSASSSPQVFTPIERTNPIVVVLPVYRDTELTRICIESAMPSIQASIDAILIIINDASPELDMADMLSTLIDRWPEHIKVLTNTHNLGFVATVNKGMRAYDTHDVVLLNSDVILPNDWLDRLTIEAYSRSNVATVTPLSNNTTICTFPEFLQENTLPFGLNVDEVDAAFRTERLPNIETPTGVGFCMYIRRHCLNEVGYLDEERFGRGYGEENDFCQRALKQGWVNLITPNLYAFHKGGVSFGTEKALLVENAMSVIDELHPTYHRSIQDFIRRDPLKESRLLRLIRLLSTIPIPKVLHISHGLGGGVEQHVMELADYYYSKGLAFPLILTPQGTGKHCNLRLGYKRTADDLLICLPEDHDLLVQILLSANVSLIHFHHILHVSPLLLQLPQQLQLPYYLTIHDFYFLNGNPTLTDESGVFVERDIDTLLNPLFTLPEEITPKMWRDKYRTFVEGAEQVIFPSTNTRRLFGIYFQFKNSVVAPHLEIARNITRLPKQFISKQFYIIGVLGALGKEKGADYLEEIAQYVSNSGLPLKFTLIGYAYRALDKIKVTGIYEADEISELIQKQECDLLLFPARCPETYSYTLSHALESGLPIVAPTIGAFPERLAGRNQVWLFEHGISAPVLVEQLLAFITKLEKGIVHSTTPFTSTGVNSNFYVVDYLTNLAISSSKKDVVISAIPQKNLKTTEYRSLTNKRSFRESILCGIWHLYYSPTMNRFSNKIPYRLRQRLRRWVKQALSKRPISEILNR
jgi:FkbM family methyltransferase